MRLDEVENYYQNLSNEDLRQQLNEDNTTGLSGDDLVKVVRTHQLNEWYEINIDDHILQIKSMIKQIKKSLEIVESKEKSFTEYNNAFL